MLARIINYNQQVRWRYQCKGCNSWLTINKQQLHGFHNIICDHCYVSYNRQAFYVSENISCYCGCGTIYPYSDIKELKLFSSDKDRTFICSQE